jgi:hypothetical protein
MGDNTVRMEQPFERIGPLGSQICMLIQVCQVCVHPLCPMHDPRQYNTKSQAQAEGAVIACYLVGLQGDQHAPSRVHCDAIITRYIG